MYLGKQINGALDRALNKNSSLIIYICLHDR